MRPAAYAKLRGLSKSTISRQVRDGKIPLTAGGLIDPAAADLARERNLSADRCQVAKERKAQLRTQKRCIGEQRAPANSEDVAELVLAGQREVLNRLLAKAAELPQLLRELGAPALAVLIVTDAFDTFFWSALQELIEPLYGWHGPPRITASDQEKSAMAGTEVETAADTLLERIDKFFGLPTGDPSDAGDEVLEEIRQ